MKISLDNVVMIYYQINYNVLYNINDILWTK